MHSIFRNKSARLFFILGGFFIANAIIAQFIGVKIFSFEDSFGLEPLDIPLFGESFSFQLSAAVLVYPVIFVFTDIINEYYGAKGVKFLTYLTLALTGYSFFIVNSAILLAPSQFFNLGTGMNESNNAFRGIFGQGTWVMVGTLAAFYVSQMTDIWIFRRVRRKTGNNKLWLRSTGSTLVSQLIDTFVMLFIAFYLGKHIQGDLGNAWTWKQLLIAGTGNYIFRFLIAIVFTPVIYLLNGLIEMYFGLEDADLMKEAAMRKENG